MSGTPPSVRPFGSRTVFEETVDVLSGFRPEYPKFYSMADLGRQSRRRWVPLGRVVDTGRVDLMFRHYFAESGDKRFSTFQVADSYAHAVLGRAVASFATMGRVWDTGTENMSVRTDIDGGLDWAGVRETSIRLLPGDPASSGRGAVALPCERSLAFWLACRSRGTLTPIFEHLSEVSDCGVDTLWSAAGECVLGASTISPTFVGASREVAHRRGQHVLDALHSAGLAVRRRSGLPRTPGAGPIPSREPDKRQGD